MTQRSTLLSDADLSNLKVLQTAERIWGRSAFVRQGEKSALNEEDTALAALAVEKYSQAVESSLEVAHKQQTDITVGSHVRQAFQQVGTGVQ